MAHLSMPMAAWMSLILALYSVAATTADASAPPSPGPTPSGPGAGPDKGARDAVYETCPQCDLQYCCTPMQSAINHQIDIANSQHGGILECSDLEKPTFTDQRVQAIFSTCGCACLDCCFDALTAGSDFACGKSLCGNGTVPTGGDELIIG